MAVALDNSYIAAACSVPESTIATLLDAPTIDLVKSFLLTVQQKAHDYDAINSAKLQLEVEVETVVRSTELRNRQTKENNDKSLKDVQELRTKLTQEETARAAVETELHALKSTTATHKAEVESLQSRISSLESSKREALALADSKTSGQTKLVDDLAAQQQKVNTLRRELTEAEERRQNAENAASTLKFREQALDQEVEALKKHNQWLDEELNRRTTEHAKFRKEKNSRVAELQRLYEDATQNIEALQRTETTLRSRQEELTQKAEDNIGRIQALQEESIRSQESHRQELDTVRRLGELQQQAADEARARAQDLQQRIEQLNDDAAEEIGHLQAEIEEAHRHREEADARISELESQIERLQSEAAAPRRNVSVPATPRRGMNGLASYGTPLRGGSPGLMSTPGGGRPLNLSDQHQAKARIESEQRRNQRLTATIEEMVREIEAKKPEMDELRTQYDHAATEIARLSQEVEIAQREREKSRKEARKWEGEAAGTAREADLSRQQVRDISLQLKILLAEQQAQIDGLDPLGNNQQLQLERIIRGELGEDALKGMSESSRYISQRLTIFRNVDELVSQNTQLLSLTRRLTEEMEGEEARLKRNQQEREREELQQLREGMTNIESELKSVEARCETFKRERDMFSQLLSRRGGDASLVAGNDNVFSPNGSRAQSTDREAMSEQSKLLRELQSSHDAYRQEATTDRSALKQQVERLGKDKSQMQEELAKIRSQLGMAQERYDLLSSNYNMLKGEHAELQKRAQSLSEMAAKQDARTQQTADELVDARGLVNGLRSEIASLKAEREIWKRMESRMEEDNKALVEERSRLNKGLADLQKLQNEREHRDMEARKEVQDRANALDTELQSLRHTLDSEKEAAKQASSRRDYEQEQQRTRIDDLLKGLGNIKEDLVKVQTERDQAQARVEELRNDLLRAEQRAAAAQARPNIRPAVTDENANHNTASADTDALSREVDDLKEELRTQERLLTIAKESEDRSRAIADEANEQLASLNDTYEQYRGETEALLQEKDVKIAELEQRTETVTADLTKTTQELSQLQMSQGESAARFRAEKDEVESQLVRLRDENERLSETSRLHREDLKAQAEIAQQAQQSYEDELIKHSEAAKALQKVRSDFNELKTEVNSFKTEAETAKESLEKSEESWTEQRKLYEKDINDLRIRRADVNEQNQLLHKQLEDFSKQLDELKRTKEVATMDGATPQPASSDNYQEIVRHLKREKEIVDMQYDISSRDCKRLQHQLDQTQSQLDQTREKLATEMRNQVESERIRMDRDKLEQSINELNVFRESNGLLRMENQKAAARIAILEQQVDEVRKQLEPLREQNLAFENSLAMKDGELKLLEENRDFWEKRTQDIMSKHNRADPAELESLKTQLTDVQAERDRLLEEKKPLQEQIDGIPEQIRVATEDLTKNWEERRARLVEQSKNKVRELQNTIREQKTETEKSISQTQHVQQELTVLQAQLETLRSERDTAVAAAATAGQTKDTAMANGVEEGQLPDEPQQDQSAVAANADLQAKLQVAEQKAAEELARAQEAGAQVEALNQRIQVLESNLLDLQQQHVQKSTPTVPAQSQIVVSQESVDGTGEAELNKVREELAATRAEVEQLKQAAQSSQPEGSAPEPISQDTANVDSHVQERVDELRKQLQEEHEAKVKAEEERFKARTDNMKQQLTTKLKDGRAKYQEEIKKEQQEEIAKLQEEHKKELERLKSNLQTTAQPAQTNGQSAPSPSQSTPVVSSQPVKVKDEEAQPAVDFNNLTPGQVKELMSNATVKGIMSRNITQKITEEKEKLAEEKQKAIEQVRELESKRSALKINIAENKAKNNQAKIDVVQQAAQDTPQRPVGEVWEIAKVAKGTAPPAKTTAAPTPEAATARPPAPVQTPAVASTPAGLTTAIGAGGASSPFAQTPASGTQAPAQSVNPFATTANQAFGQPAFNQGQNPFAQPGFGRGAPPASNQVANPFASQQAQQQQPAPQSQLQPPQAGAGLPPRPNAPPAGTGPGALRGLMGQHQAQGVQSGIPRPGGPAGTGGHATRGGRGGFGQPSGQGHQQQAQANNQGQANEASDQQQGGTSARGGSQLPRGGARGGRGGRGGARGGRGGLPQPGQQMVPGAGRGAASPGGAGAMMNPGANQFVPGGAGNGNKRAADGKPDGESAEKKAKG